MATTQKQLQKVAKKKWFKVLATPEFQNMVIGETPAFEAEQVLGRVIVANLSTLTRDMRKQSTSLSFKVKEIKGADAHTEVVKYELNPIHIKRLVRKGRSKIDDSFMAETKDKVKVRIKPLLLTKCITQKGIVTAVRLKAREVLAQELQKMTYGEFVLATASGNLMKTVKAEAKKVYPLAIAEMRLFSKE
ncbi:hypothetical protein HY501_02700 [Candidatus Woesearchaeota archaeon]|nr:hypothetical protein [Candidatus Woesearchaeota archaeon]